ncbi:Mannosyl-3-phosphoglycerate synthase, partial [ANME-1 cluster archaeon GoMg1]|nr:Mannosyl-3-phosphoglycerate synthase [ANME-1 cluster archaeon GoMg1]
CNLVVINFRNGYILLKKDEKIHLLDGVLRAIPFDCTIIVVSNSGRDEHDLYKMEKDVITRLHELTQQKILLIHQKDPEVGFAFYEAGYDYLLDKDDLVRDGKSEGMIIGMLLAKSMGKDFIGFADADNYIPGSVREYVLDYAAGFCMSESPYSMVRLHWRYKPKVVEERLYFKKWGRVSEATNRYLNLLLSTNSGFETGVIVTGNAGEHALTTKLADIMCYSPGYSVEPYHFVYLFDVFGHKAEKITYPDAEAAGIEIFQIETLNPHLHEEKGEEHIKNMLLGSLGTIYNSELCNDYVRSKVLGELGDILDTWEKPPEVTVMPPIGGIDADRFMNMLEGKSETLVRYKETRR